MRKMIAILVFTAALTVVTGVFAQGDDGRKAPVTTVASVDLDRYAGKWYELARYPNKFQKMCVGNTTATYSLKENGRIEVLNECLKDSGETQSAKAEAKVVKGSSNSKLKVRFAPGFLSFLSFVWGDYWVIDLDRDYKYAVVADPSRKYLWILSRTPEMDTATYGNILEKIEQQGFEPDRLVKTPQTNEK